jgi:transposase-like protein
MSQRHEFVMLFEQEGVNRRELCRRFGVSPTIGYRLLARWRADGKAGLADRSRRPQHSPGRSAAAMERLVLAVRDEHPAWGGRKIRRRLQDLKHRRCRAPARLPRYCIAMAASSLRPLPATNRLNGLSGRRRTSCGRWTTRGILRRARGAAIR